MKKLNKNYNDATLLSDWWGIVKDNFDAVEQHTAAAEIDHPNGSVTRAKLAGAVTTELNGLRTDVNKKAEKTDVGDKSQLQTTNKSNLVAAVNELKQLKLQVYDITTPTDAGELIEDGIYHSSQMCLTGCPEKEAPILSFRDGYGTSQFQIGHGNVWYRCRYWESEGVYVWTEWRSDIGNLEDLEIPGYNRYSTIVSSINTFWQDHQSLKWSVGSLSDLTTAEKNNVVSAVNEVVSSKADKENGVFINNPAIELKSVGLKISSPAIYITEEIVTDSGKYTDIIYTYSAKCEIYYNGNCVFDKQITKQMKALYLSGDPKAEGHMKINYKQFLFESDFGRSQIKLDEASSTINGIITAEFIRDGNGRFTALPTGRLEQTFSCDDVYQLSNEVDIAKINGIIEAQRIYTASDISVQYEGGGMGHLVTITIDGAFALEPGKAIYVPYVKAQLIAGVSRVNVNETGERELIDSRRETMSIDGPVLFVYNGKTWSYFVTFGDPVLSNTEHDTPAAGIVTVTDKLNTKALNTDISVPSNYAMYNYIGKLTDLKTYDKTNIVSALNSVYSKVEHVDTTDTDGAITVGREAKSHYNNIAIGEKADASNAGGGSMAIGQSSLCTADGSTAVGAGATVDSNISGTALGWGATSQADYACQIGEGKNTQPYTTKLYDYQLTSSDHGMGTADTKQYLTDVGKISDLTVNNRETVVDAVNELNGGKVNKHKAVFYSTPEIVENPIAVKLSNVQVTEEPKKEENGINVIPYTYEADLSIETKNSTFEKHLQYLGSYPLYLEEPTLNDYIDVTVSVDLQEQSYMLDTVMGSQAVSQNIVTEEGIQYYTLFSQTDKIYGLRKGIEFFGTNQTPQLLATQNYAKGLIKDLVGSAPEALNTIEELAAAIEDNPDMIHILEESITKKADKQNADGGFTGGDGAVVEWDGAAVGKEAKVTKHDGIYGRGFAGGYRAQSKNGGASGSLAQTFNGGAAGNASYSYNGGAVGSGAKTSNGFAGGQDAVCENNSGIIDAVQLGAGKNDSAGTFQVYGHRMMNADGTIPAKRIPELGVLRTSIDTLNSKAFKVYDHTEPDVRVEDCNEPGIHLWYNYESMPAWECGFPEYENSGALIVFNVGGKIQKYVFTNSVRYFYAMKYDGTWEQFATDSDIDWVRENIGDLPLLNTTDKTSLVSAVNECYANIMPVTVYESRSAEFNAEYEPGIYVYNNEPYSCYGLPTADNMGQTATIIHYGYGRGTMCIDDLGHMWTISLYDGAKPENTVWSVLGTDRDQMLTLRYNGVFFDPKKGEARQAGDLTFYLLDTGNEGKGAIYYNLIFGLGGNELEQKGVIPNEDIPAGNSYLTMKYVVGNYKSYVFSIGMTAEEYTEPTAIDPDFEDEENGTDCVLYAYSLGISGNHIAGDEVSYSQIVESVAFYPICSEKEVGVVSSLQTTDKSNLVAAVNEIKGALNDITVGDQGKPGTVKLGNAADANVSISVGIRADSHNGSISIGAQSNSYTDSISIGTESSSYKESISIGARAFSEEGCTALGADAKAHDGVAVGCSAEGGGVCVGNYAKALDETGSAIEAVQFGRGTNSKRLSIKIYDYQLTTASGTSHNNTQQYLTDVGKLPDLETAQKTDIVSAINELTARIAALEAKAGV